MRRRAGLLVQATALAVLLALASWVFIAPEPKPQPLPAATPVKVPPEQACREWSLAAMAMADHLDRAFARHAAAHHAYQAGKMPFGPADKPGTVLYVWKQTLHQRRVHAVHYRELRAAWRQACLGDVGAGAAA